MRYEIDFNDNWLFHKGDITHPKSTKKGPVYSQSKTERKLSGPASYFYYDNTDPYFADCELKDDGWEYVNLPHDYIVTQDLNEHENNAHGFFTYYNAWYRKHFSLDTKYANKRILLRFDGIAGKSTIYLNGCLMYHNFSSYNTFEIDISDNVYFERENVIAVYVDTGEFEGWWYQGGGIYRDVVLSITEPVAIRLWGVYAPYKKLDENNWQVDFQTEIVNTSYQNCTVTAQSFILDKDLNCIASADGTSDIDFRDTAILKYSTVVFDPLLWDTDTPNLYTVKTVLKINDEPIDQNITKIGFRTVEISAENTLLINGKRKIIKGVCAHQDFGLTGLVMPENIAKYKISLIKQMGANAYRTSHYQHTACLLDACDEQGLLVMDEVRWFESTKEALEQLTSLVKRDRNRPSVIFWCTSNEEPYQITDNGKRIHKAMAAHIKKLDNTRFITAAVSETPDKSTVYDDCDVIGINYNLNIYDTVHSMLPNKALFASECCAAGTTRDWNYPTDTQGRMQEKDTDLDHWFLARERTWKFLMGRPFILGGFQWTAVEHRGEAAWPCICSKSGAIDLFLQPKGAFYQNKSHWTDEPMVHIVPHWNFEGLEGTDILVTAYTNCDTLELFVNEKSYSKIQVEKYGHAEWHVPYTPGKLQVNAYRNGKFMCNDTRITTKKPKSLKLSLRNDCSANGKDIALFNCECIDGNGLIVPDAAEFVKFSVAAPAKIIGTGSDNCDIKNVANCSRKMYMGKICVGVKPKKDQKTIKLYAFSETCGTAQIEINLLP